MISVLPALGSERPVLAVLRLPPSWSPGHAGSLEPPDDRRRAGVVKPGEVRDAGPGSIAVAEIGGDGWAGEDAGALCLSGERCPPDAERPGRGGDGSVLGERVADLL